EAGQGTAEVEISLGARRLSAARCAPYRIQSGRRTIVQARRSRGKARTRREERRDADHRAHIEHALSLAHRRCELGGHRQQGKDDAARFHHRGRVPHHAQMPHVPLAADSGRGAAALQERAARLRETQKHARSEEATPFQDLDCYNFALFTQVRDKGPIQGRNVCSEVSGSPSPARSSRSSTVCCNRDGSFRCPRATFACRKSPRRFAKAPARTSSASTRRSRWSAWCCSSSSA